MDQSVKDNIERLTGEHVLKSLVRLAVPIMLYSCLHISYQLVNTFWIGRLGPEALASVTVSFPILFFFVAAAGGLSTAASTLTSQHAGARDFNNITRIFAQLVTLIVALALFCCAIGYVFTDTLLEWVGTNAEIHAEARDYLRVSFASLIFIYFFTGFESVMRGLGEVKMPFFVVLASVILNVILDPLFIYGWGPLPAMGVVGAAYATLCAQLLMTIVCLWIITGKRYGIKPGARNFIPDGDLCRKFLGLGLPSSIQQSVQSIAVAALTALVAYFGTSSTAAYGVTLRIFMLVTIPAIGISMATATMAGLYVGGGYYARAKAVGLWGAGLSFALLSVLGAGIFIWAADITQFFIPTDIAAAETSTYFLRIISVSLGFIGAFITLTGFFSGAGKTTMAAVLSMVSIFVLQLPLAYFLSRHTALDASGVLYSNPISGIITLLISLIAWRWCELRSLYRTAEPGHPDAAVPLNSTP